MKRSNRPKLPWPSATRDHGPKEWERPAWPNCRPRSWIGSVIAVGARSVAWPGWCPANGAPETTNGWGLTKVGVPAIRRIITEAVWRIILFQPQYQPVQKWQEVLSGTNRALKKKAIVAIGRQLMVDLWRVQTGRISAQELNLVMIGG